MPEDEHALAPEAVAERGAGQQQDRVGEHVGADGPLERLDRSSQVAVDARQATLTTRLSSTTMNRPIETIASVQPRWLGFLTCELPGRLMAVPFLVSAN